MSDAAQHILVVGVGNELLTDDGVGVHAVRQLQRESLPGVTVVEIGTAILHGLSFVEEADRVLVIDAARGGQPPGTIYRFEAREGVRDGGINSIHALGLHEAARLLLAGGRVPPVTVLGVEPESLGYGMALSGPVQAALPRVVSLVRETIAQWRGAAAARGVDAAVAA
jgi:hydrogenase maturation protease